MTSPRPDEANVITRYLVDADCPPELAARYESALQQLTRNSQLATRNSQLATQFALRHPTLLPYIAAAAPFFASGALLRWKLTVMAAILETSPRFAHEFLPRELPLTRLVATVVLNAAVAGIRAVIGAPLLFAARFTR